MLSGKPYPTRTTVSCSRSVSLFETGTATICRPSRSTIGEESAVPGRGSNAVGLKIARSIPGFRSVPAARVRHIG
eukprot:5513081-Prymnesium_polylepis.3